MCCCSGSEFSSWSLNAGQQQLSSIHTAAIVVLPLFWKKKSVFFKSRQLQEQIHCRNCKGASWLEWTFDWYSPKLGKAVDWVEAGLPFARTWVHSAEMGSQKPPRAQQREVLCQTFGTKEPWGISVDRRAAVQVASPLKVTLEVRGRQWTLSQQCLVHPE